MDRRRPVDRSKSLFRSSRCVTLLLLIATIFIGFLLTSRYHLANSEQVNRHIGWQAQAKAFRAKAKAQMAKPNVIDETNPEGYGEMDEDDEMMGDSGGNPFLNGLGDGFSKWKPSKDWDPLARDTRPITEIQLISCIIPPSIGNLCQPKTNKADSFRGPWTRVERDLNARVGIYFLFLFERRLQPGSTLPVITNITLLTHTPTSKDLNSDRGVWVEVSENLRSGLQSPKLDRMTLHYHLTAQEDIEDARRESEVGDAGALEPITELDIIYGDSRANPLFGFTKVPRMITGGDDDASESRIGSALAIRRTLPTVTERPSLEFSLEGNFTILQVADLHFSTGPGACRDMAIGQQRTTCEKRGADRYSLDWLKLAIKETKASLIVLTGDQSNGQDTSWSTQTAIMKWAPTLVKSQIPWTVVFGNHDAEVGASRKEQMAMMRTMPYFIGEAGPEDVDGTGNYIRSIKSGDSSNATLFNLYFLDSHANVKSFGFFNSAGYDFIKPSQINWFKSTSSKVRAVLRPYLPEASASSPVSSKEDLESELIPMEDYDERRSRRSGMSSHKKRQLDSSDGGADSIGVEFGMIPDDGSKITGSVDGYNEGYGELGVQEVKSAVNIPLATGPELNSPLMAKPNAMTFFHIPLIESYESPIDIGEDLKPLVIGERFEGSGASKTNSGFFEQAILAQNELMGPTSSKDPTSSPEIMDAFWEGEDEQTHGRSETKVIVNGHCHISEDCRRIKGVWNCFGGGSAFSGYGKEGFERRMRVFSLSHWGERIETFKLLDSLKEIDRVVLVGEGARV